MNCIGCLKSPLNAASIYWNEGTLRKRMVVVLDDQITFKTGFRSLAGRMQNGAISFFLCVPLINYCVLGILIKIRDVDSLVISKTIKSVSKIKTDPGLKKLKKTFFYNKFKDDSVCPNTRESYEKMISFLRIKIDKLYTQESLNNYATELEKYASEFTETIFKTEDEFNKSFFSISESKKDLFVNELCEEILNIVKDARTRAKGYS